jgi:hypothetical protein
MFNQAFEDVDADTLAMEYWNDMKDELNVKSIWSIHEAGSIDSVIFTKRMRKVTYEFVRPDATSEELQADLRDGGKRASAEVSSWAVDGTVKSLWHAADSCISQSGTHHIYIEDLEIQEDGTVSLTTGS